MELIKYVRPEQNITQTVISEKSPFIEANTVSASWEEINEHHIIPVFSKDNEPLISHAEFIETVESIVRDYYSSETILKPNIRLSHPIKGRVPEARNKPANELEEWEKTLYYERMAFIIEIPSIQDEIAGNRLSLTIGGVKAYNLDNMNGKKGTDQHFKMFIGFQNQVCTNLCVWTDGLMDDIKVKEKDTLTMFIHHLLERYRVSMHLNALKDLANYHLTERQFAQFIGKCRMYQYLPKKEKQKIPEMAFGDQQISMAARGYYEDPNFGKQENGDINLWSLYNLLTGANKTTYIDQFACRSSNAYGVGEQLKYSLQGISKAWYLS
jgi:hypothetical protein